MFLHVTDVKPSDRYQLVITFNNGVTKRVDLEPELYGEVFEPLKDKERFQQVAVNPETNTVEWANGADFAPEFLYEVGEEVERVA